MKENNEMKEVEYKKEKFKQSNTILYIKEYNSIMKKYNEKSSLIEEKNDEIFLLKNKIRAIIREDSKTIETDPLMNKEITNSEFNEIQNEHNEIIKSKP